MKSFRPAGRPSFEHCGGRLGLCQRPSVGSYSPICNFNRGSRTNSGGPRWPSYKCLFTPEATYQQFTEADNAGMPKPLNPYDLLKQSLKSIGTSQRNALPDRPTLSKTGSPGGSGGGRQGGAGGAGGGNGDGWWPEDDNPFGDPDWIGSTLCIAAVLAAFELVQKCLHLDGVEGHRPVCYKPCFASVAMDEYEAQSYSREERSRGGGGLFIVVGIVATVGVSVARFFKARKNRKQRAQEPCTPVSTGGEHTAVHSRGLNLAALRQPTPDVTVERINEVPAMQQAEDTSDAENLFLQAKKEKDAFFGVSRPTYATGQIRPEGFANVRAPQAPAAVVPEVGQLKPEAAQVEERAVGMDKVVQDTRSGNIFMADMESKDRFFGSSRRKVVEPAPTDLDSKARFFGSSRPKVEEQAPTELDSKDRFFGSAWPRGYYPAAISDVQTIVDMAVTEEKDNVFLSSKEEKDAFFGVTSPTYAKGQLRPDGFNDVKAPVAAPAMDVRAVQLKPEEVQVQERAVGLDRVVQDTRMGNIFTSDLDSKDNFFGSPQPKAVKPATSSAEQTVPNKKENVFLQLKEEKDSFFGVTSPTYAQGQIHPAGFGDVAAPAAVPAVVAEVVQVKPEAVQVEETAIGMDRIVQDTRSGNIFTADLESKYRFFGFPQPKPAETPAGAADHTAVEKVTAVKAAPEGENTLLSAKDEKDAFFRVTSPTYAKGQLRPDGFNDVKAPVAAPAMDVQAVQLKPEDVQVQERARGTDKVVQDTRSGNIFASDLISKDSFFGAPGMGPAKTLVDAASLKVAEQVQQKAAEPVHTPNKEEPKAASTVAVRIKATPQGIVALKFDVKAVAGAAEPSVEEFVMGTAPPNKPPKVVKATSMPAGIGGASKRNNFLQPVLEEPAYQEPGKEGPCGSQPLQSDEVPAQPQEVVADPQTTVEEMNKITQLENASRSTPRSQFHRGRGRGRGGGKRGKKK